MFVLSFKNVGVVLKSGQDNEHHISAFQLIANRRSWELGEVFIWGSYNLRAPLTSLLETAPFSPGIPSQAIPGIDDPPQL